LNNHDPNQVLGRTRSGTLKLAVNDRGLHYSVELPNSSLGDNVYQSVKRGDVSGSSFGFTCLKDSWDGNSRTLLDLDLLDAGPVTYPAYANTSVQVRSASGATTMVQLAWYRAAAGKLRLPLGENEMRARAKALQRELRQMMGDDDADDQERECSCPCDSCQRDSNCPDCDCGGCASVDCQSGDSEDCRCAGRREAQGRMKPSCHTIYPSDAGPLYRETLQKEMGLTRRLFDARQAMKKWR
jgi:hypothetical protein